jgi:hypothetical protein
MPAADSDAYYWAPWDNFTCTDVGSDESPVNQCSDVGGNR